MIIKKSNRFNENQKVMLNVSKEIKENNSNNQPTSRGDSDSISNKIDSNLYVDGNIYVNTADYSYENDNDNYENDFPAEGDYIEKDEAGEGSIIAAGTIIGKDIYPKEHYYLNVDGVKKDLMTDYIFVMQQQIKNVSDNLAAHITASNKKFTEVDTSITSIKSSLNSHITFATNKFTEVDSSITSIKSSLNSHITSSNNKFTEVDTSISDLSTRIKQQLENFDDNITDSIDNISTRLSNTESSLSTHITNSNTKFTNINSSISTLNTYISNVSQTASDNSSKIIDISTRLSQIKSCECSGSSSASDILLYGSSTNPIVLFSGDSSKQSGNYYLISGNRNEKIISMTAAISDGLMTVSITPASGWKANISAISVTQRYSEKTAAITTTLFKDNRNVGAHWFEARPDTTQGTTKVYIREFHQIDKDKDSWDSATWFYEGGVRSVNIIMTGYMSEI